MQIISKIDEITRDFNSFVTVGTFDGVHVAHQSIIKKVVRESKEKGGRSVVVTFEPHPRTIVNNKDKIYLLSTLDEKIEIFKLFDVDILLIIKFDKNFSVLSASEFFKKIIYDKVGVKELIVGFDHNFGKDRLGNIDLLKEMQSDFDFSIEIIQPIFLNGDRINSTRIRQSLIEGNVEKSRLLLGRPYSISGRVVKGDQRGRSLGFPTANIRPDDPLKLIPKNGVYFVEVMINNKKYNGFLNIGKRPTFGESNKIFIETNIFDFNSDIYDETIKIDFLSFIRDEKKFESPNDLAEQLKKDKEICLNILKINN